MTCATAGIKIYGSNPVVEYNDFWENVADIESDDTNLTFPTGNIYTVYI